MIVHFRPRRSDFRLISPFSGNMSDVYITGFILILIYLTKSVFIAHCHILFVCCSHHLLFRKTYYGIVISAKEVYITNLLSKHILLYILEATCMHCQTYLNFLHKSKCIFHVRRYVFQYVIAFSLREKCLFSLLTGPGLLLPVSDNTTGSQKEPYGGIICFLIVCLLLDRILLLLLCLRKLSWGKSIALKSC